MKKREIIKKSAIYCLSILSAAGSGLQNTMAIFSLIKTGPKLILGVLHGLGIAFGGVCGGLVNLCVNVDLLESFFERITKKKRPTLHGWKRFQYWFGSGVFIVTGVLFGLTAVALGPVGALAAIGIIAGIFVAGLMIIQELETWLESFDDPEQNKKSIKQVFKEWKASLTRGKILGIVIAIGNVLALSLLFTLGLVTFMTGVGVPILPALIASATVAFTGGTFTEFYFYSGFLSNFCSKLKENFKKFWQSKYSPLGLLACSINAIVNGVLSYVGISMVVGLLVTAGMAMPPVGVIIAVAATLAVFAAGASFILGLSFWEKKLGKKTVSLTQDVIQPALENKEENSTEWLLDTMPEQSFSSDMLTQTCAIDKVCGTQQSSPTCIGGLFTKIQNKFKAVPVLTWSVKFDNNIETKRVR